MRWRWTLSQALAIGAMLLMLGALAQFFLGADPVRHVRFLWLRDAALPLLLAIGWLATAQRRIDWADRPEKLSRLRFVAPILVLAVVLMAVAFGFAPLP